jgi:23S rRNA (adenine2030-N6)-methyltransferase
MDYAHARHAGNAGDVFKHAALLALFEACQPKVYVETHAGDGLYPLGSAGEWVDGAQRLFSTELQPGLLKRLGDLVRGFSGPGATRPGTYPGSPAIAAKLSPGARMVLHELDARAAALLRKHMPQAEVHEADGSAGLPVALKGASSALALVDPPYTGKQEWTDAARAMGAARQANPDAALALWYPIKALTRPRALLGELVKHGVHGIAVELHWTPLRLKRDKLNGSGMIFVNCPRDAVAAVCAAMPDLGALLQTHGEWGAVEIGF